MVTGKLGINVLLLQICIFVALPTARTVSCLPYPVCVCQGWRGGNGKQHSQLSAEETGVGRGLQVVKAREDKIRDDCTTLSVPLHMG